LVEIVGIEPTAFAL